MINNLVYVTVTRTVLCGIAVLISLGSAPFPAYAAPPVVDLVLGGEGSTSWNIDNIAPSDYGIKTVTLHNAGTADGLVTIWISDIVSHEGLNPESETGDITGSGELDANLIIDAAAEGLKTNLSLPTVLRDMPDSAIDSDFIEIMPLKDGTTITLDWVWVLPEGTSNEVQGDNVSFTINYLLREIEITDVSGIVDSNGIFTQTAVVESIGDEGTIVIAQNTEGRTAEGDPVSELWLIEVDREPQPSDGTVVSYYNAGPSGTTFDQPVTITLNYRDPEDIPSGVSEEELVIALWDETLDTWVELPSVVDSLNNTVSAQITHFSDYSVIAPTPPPPPLPDYDSEPSEPKPPVVELPPPPVEPEVPVLETNILGNKRPVPVREDGTIPVPVTLTDENRTFIIDLERGARITDGTGSLVTRIELTIAEEFDTIRGIERGPVLANVPGDIMLLSPVYELKGYIGDVEVPRLIFNLPVNLTIKYDPENVPQNALTPFIAYYKPEIGLITIEKPPGAMFEVGTVHGQITHATFFVAAIRIAPPPEPLPPKFVVRDLLINPEEAVQGKPIKIILTIDNEGETQGSYEFYVQVDGIVRLIREITVPAQSTTEITFEITDLAPGVHRIKLAGLTGKVRILKSAPSPLLSSVNWQVLDIAIVALVIIGLMALYYVKRRARPYKM